MKNRIIGLFLALAMCFSLVSNACAFSFINSHTQVRGSQFSEAYADKLDAIFQGKVALFTNTSEKFPLGSSLNNNKEYRVAGSVGGYQCYIYAQAVYYYLFGDIPFRGDGYGAMTHSQKVLSNQVLASYEIFRDAGVGFGAYVRTTTNTDGSFNGGSGHSFIILSYDREGVTYLEANADGYGLVRITVRTWEEFNSNQLGGRGRRISSVVQCTDGVFCFHNSFDSLGKCTVAGCGEVFSWKRYFSADDKGIYKTTQELTLRKDAPYSAAAYGEQVAADKLIEVLGSCKNAFGETWYQCSYNGEIGFAREEDLTYFCVAALEVTCDDFSPADQAVLDRKSHPVIGTVTSNYPLSYIEAYLDGKQFAVWKASNKTTTQVNLRQTDINKNLSFSSLKAGKHTIKLVAYSYVHEQPLTFLNSVFYMEYKDGNTPDKPVLNVTLNGNRAGFTWDDVSGKTHYNLYIARKNELGQWENVSLMAYAESGCLSTLEKGVYRASLYAYNSNAWESDGSEWRHTKAEDVTFTVDVSGYCVRFDANGGSDAPAEVTAVVQTPVKIPTETPHRKGYKFVGWSASVSGEGAVIAPGAEYTHNADITLYALWEKQTFDISGQVISFLEDGTVTLQLFKVGASECEYSASLICGNSQAKRYSIEGVEPGAYTLVVSKDGHASRTYSVIVDGENVHLDAQINPVGDLNGDGMVNVKDYQILMRHVNETSLLEGYALICGDITDDGSVTVKDFQRLLRHVNETDPLY